MVSLLAPGPPLSLNSEDTSIYIYIYLSLYIYVYIHPVTDVSDTGEGY